LDEPNPDYPLVADAAYLYKHDRDKYNKLAMTWVIQYASGEFD
jgi:ubiquitin-protein ligase